MARLVSFGNSQAVAVSRTIFEIGSALNGGRPKLMRLLADPSVPTIMVDHRDRRMRFECEWMEAALAAQASGSWWRTWLRFKKAIEAMMP
jgi:putative resolvase